MIEAKDAYTAPYESGVHRVQRVPLTEAQGRIHTSTVTVAVLPEPEELELNINPDEIESTSSGERARRPTRQHHRFGGEDDPPAHRPGGYVPGREITAQEQGESHKGAQGTA